MIICKTPLRVSFLGGGTDWPEFFTRHGGAVLGTTIDKYIYHSITHFYSHLFDYSIRLSYRNVECVKSVEDIDHGPFREILKAFGITRDIEINLAADLPAFSGLGSSSSFTVGLIKGLNAYQGKFISKHELAYQAIEMERSKLAEAVGCQDQVFAAFGGFNVIEFNGLNDIAVHKVTIDSERVRELDHSLLLFFTGQVRRASGIERSKMERLSTNSDYLMRMLKMVERGHSLLVSRREMGVFGELLDQAWNLKKQLSPDVSNSTVDRMYELARSSGAIGGKLLGAGGGGFLLLFVPLERQDRVRAVLADFPEVPFRMSQTGSHIIHS
jgi:D-glycero-alpha-D-manno-heptose-7-phosphate kinase